MYNNNMQKTSDLFFGRPAQHFMNMSIDDGVSKSCETMHSRSSNKEMLSQTYSQDLFTQAQSETEIPNSAFDKYMALKIPDNTVHASRTQARSSLVDSGCKTSKEQPCSAECKNHLIYLQENVNVLSKDMGNMKANLEKLVTLLEREEKNRFIIERDFKELLTKLSCDMKELAAAVGKNNKDIESWEKHYINLKEMLEDMFEKLSSHIVKQSEELNSNLFAFMKHDATDIDSVQTALQKLTQNISQHICSEKREHEQETVELSRGIQLLLEEFKNVDVAGVVTRRFNVVMEHLEQNITNQLQELKKGIFQNGHVQPFEDNNYGYFSSRSPSVAPRFSAFDPVGTQKSLRKQNNSTFSFGQMSNFVASRAETPLSTSFAASFANSRNNLDVPENRSVLGANHNGPKSNTMDFRPDSRNHQHGNIPKRQITIQRQNITIRSPLSSVSGNTLPSGFMRSSNHRDGMFPYGNWGQAMSSKKQMESGTSRQNFVPMKENHPPQVSNSGTEQGKAIGHHNWSNSNAFQKQEPPNLMAHRQNSSMLQMMVFDPKNGPRFQSSGEKDVSGFSMFNDFTSKKSTLKSDPEPQLIPRDSKYFVEFVPEEKNPDFRNYLPSSKLETPTSPPSEQNGSEKRYNFRHQRNDINYGSSRQYVKKINSFSRRNSKSRNKPFEQFSRKGMYGTPSSDDSSNMDSSVEMIGWK